VEDAVFLHVDRGWLRAGIVKAKDLKVASITRTFFVCRYDSVRGLPFHTDTAKS
jgi:hypothetical protein